MMWRVVLAVMWCNGLNVLCSAPLTFCIILPLHRSQHDTCRVGCAGPQHAEEEGRASKRKVDEPSGGAPSSAAPDQATSEADAFLNEDGNEPAWDPLATPESPPSPPKQP